MNITKEFYDYVSMNSGNIPSFKFNYERGSPIYKCNQILRKINETDNNIKQITNMSKKSSVFNDRHLKFSNASGNIKKTLMDIEKEIKNLQTKEINSNPYTKCEKLIANNCVEILNTKAGDLTIKFQKFLKNQGELIKKVEQRKNKISISNNINKKNYYNEFINSSNNTADNEEDVLLNMAGKIQINKENKSEYYQQRLNEVQSIEKTMGDIGQMVNRLSNMTYQHSMLIENIGRNTDIAYDNVEAGEKEIKGILENVKGNRALLIKIFLIIIFVGVIYIILF